MFNPQISRFAVPLGWVQGFRGGDSWDLDAQMRELTKLGRFLISPRVPICETDMKSGYYCLHRV